LLKLSPDLNPQFLLTLPFESKTWRRISKAAKGMGLENYIKNLGVLNVVNCKEVYLRSDLVFLPTLLEVSSATYLEAMVLGVPILTTDTDFSREACLDYAVYFRPHSHYDAAFEISNIFKSLHAVKLKCERHPIRAKLFQQQNENKSIMISMLEKITTSEISNK